MPVLHLPAIAFKPDGSGGRHRERIRQNLAVAGAKRDAVCHRDLDFIPILRLIFLQILVRPGDEIIAALQLRLADEDTAVRIGGGAKFQPEIEVVGKLARRSDFLHQPRCPWMHGQDAVCRRIAAVVTGGFAIEIICQIAPAGEVYPVEQADVTRFQFEIVGTGRAAGDRNGQESDHG